MRRFSLRAVIGLALLLPHVGLPSAGAIDVKPDAFIALDGGSSGTCAITYSHTLYCWGARADGTISTVPAPMTISSSSGMPHAIRQVSVGYSHTCAVTLDGHLYCWGQNGSGQLGNGTFNDETTPQLVASASGFTQGEILSVATGDNHTCAVTLDHEAFCWGNNLLGALGINTLIGQFSAPVKVHVGEGLTSAVSVTAGYEVSCAITEDKEAYCWGDNNAGKLGNGTTSPEVDEPVAVLAGDGLTSGTVEAIEATRFTVCALANGHMFCWGSGPLGDGPTSANNNEPQAVAASGGLTQGHIVDFSVGASGACALDDVGDVYCWKPGLSGGLLPNMPGNNLPAKVQTGEGLSSGSAIGLGSGTYYACALTSSETYCWWKNGSGQLGNGRVSLTYEPDPTRVVFVPGIAPRPLELASISAGDYHTCAVDVENDAYCWGLGADGRLGQNVVLNRSSPSRISPATGLSPGTVAQVAAGGSHSCARSSSGSVYCWGANWVGQVGDGTTESQLLPTLVAGPAGFGTATDIDAGWAHTCMVNTAGAIYCWGSGAEGQLGNGTDSASSTPVAVSSGGGYTGSNAVSVDAGDAHTCAVLNNGDGVCWGTNTSGQLGNGTTTSTLAPVAISSLTSAADISAGGNHTCALRSNGAVSCWGANAAGQLGQGNTTATSTPTAVTAASDSSSVAAGRLFTCATKTAGTTLCWGRNDTAQSGRLGGSNLLTPTRVSFGEGLVDDVLQVSAGGKHACAVNAGGESLCWGQNSFGQLGNGATSTSGNEPVFVLTTRRRAG